MTIDQQKLDSLLETAVGDLSAGYAGVMISLGEKLGLFRAMAGAGPVSSRELARRTGCAERYVREWLNAQAAGGYLVYHAASETYEMTPEQAMVLAEDTSPVYIPPAWQVPASMWFDEEKAVTAFRTGAGVSWGDHDGRLYCGVAAFYRNTYRSSLATEWIPALDGVEARLREGIRVADVGCGHGHSMAIMADAFPASEFWGFDTHAESIGEARVMAGMTGSAERMHFDVADAKSYPRHGYDLICFFDCLHDMGDPVSAVRYAREALNEGGTVMLVEPFAADRVEDNLNPVGRLYYAASTTLCCAHAISEGGPLALGAQAGAARLGEVFASAGFGSFRKAAENPFSIVFEARV